MSHRDLILKHLRRYGSIGFFDALRLYELRRDGHDIRTVKHKGFRWVRYELAIPEQTEMW